MNFGLAADLADADGIEVETVVVKDDVAVPDSTFSTGRRGIAGTVFVHKIAGAMAEKGAPLSEVKRAAQHAIDNIRSMGMAMSPCTLPAVGKPGFSLGEDIPGGISVQPSFRAACKCFLARESLARTVPGGMLRKSPISREV